MRWLGAAGTVPDAADPAIEAKTRSRANSLDKGKRGTARFSIAKASAVSNPASESDSSTRTKNHATLYIAHGSLDHSMNTNEPFCGEDSGARAHFQEMGNHARDQQ